MSSTTSLRRSRIAITLSFFIFGVLTATLFSRFPAMASRLDLSLAQLSLVPLFMAVGSMLFMPVCANLVARFGSKRLSLVAILYFALFPLLALMPNLYALYTMSLTLGVCTSMTDVSINANSILLERLYQRPIISLFHAFYYIGMATGALITVFVVQLGWSLMAHFAASACFGLVSFALVRPRFIDDRPSVAQRPTERFTILLPKGLLLLIAMIAFLGRIIEGATSEWSTVYMNQIIELSENLSPLGLAAYSLFISFGRLFGNQVRARYDDPTTLMWSCLITVVGIGTLISSPTVEVAIVGLFISGLGLSNVVPVIYSLAAASTPANPGVGLATVNTISSIGYFFGPAVIGLIAERYSLRISFGYVFLLCVATSVLAWWHRRCASSI